MIFRLSPKVDNARGREDNVLLWPPFTGIGLLVRTGLPVEWTPEEEASSSWTPETEAESTWTPETPASPDWTPEMALAAEWAIENLDSCYVDT